MAEALLRSRAPEGVVLSSAGIGALVGKPADPNALKLMEERGIDISEHRGRQLTPQIIQDADLILVMEKGHQDAVHSISPTARGKVHTICKWDDIDVPDPYRKSPEYFEHILEMIEKGVDQWSSKLWG